MLRKRAALRATNSAGNTNSAQISVTGPVEGVAARNRKDTHANVDQGVITANPLTTNTISTSPISTSPICIHSTPSSTSGESEVPSPTEEWRTRSQNRGSILVTKGDRVGKELASALGEEKMKTNTVPLITDIGSSTIPTPSNVSFPAEAKGTNEEPGAIHPTIEVKMNTQGDRSSCTLPMPPRTGLETIADRDDTQYNKQTEIKTITTENLLTTSTISLVLATNSTLSDTTDASLPSQADESEANPKLCPTAIEGDEVGKEQFIEAHQLDNVAVKSDSYQEVADPLTRTNTYALAPIANNNTLDMNAPIRVASSTLLNTPDPSPPMQTEVSTVDKEMYPTTDDDGAGKQEDMKVTPNDTGTGQYEKQIVVAHDSLSSRSTCATTPLEVPFDTT